MAGKVRLELTTCGFGDHHSSQLSYFPVYKLQLAPSSPVLNQGPATTTVQRTRLTGLLVESMLAVKLAIFHLLQAFRSIAFLLLGRIITTLALCAFQNNQFACHGRKLFFGLSQHPNWIPLWVHYMLSSRIAFRTIRDNIFRISILTR